mmetsp:Transcript_72921/g.122216  ORF Transcript_72921/g.122216 Transcript_72921/m.122216 type:complete len:216 (+) Transcript_72921:697-1344(+)
MGPSSCRMIQLRYSPAYPRSSGDPAMCTKFPTYSTMAPEARASFLRVAPFFPRAHDISSIFSSFTSVPHSSSSVGPGRMCFVRCPGSRCSIATITLSSDPRRPRRSPKIASFSSSSPLRPLLALLSVLRQMKNMIVPYSCSTCRKKLPFVPVTKPAHSLGTSTMVQSSLKLGSVSSMTTSPTRWAMTHSTYFLAFRRSSAPPVISSVRDRGGSSR